MNNNFEIAKTVLQQQGKLTGITAGNSMQPLFRDSRDKAVIVPINEDLKRNDVILYKKSTTNDVVLHRIIKFKNQKPVLRGDSLFFTETDIPQGNVIGVMEGFYRNGKYYNCKKSLPYKLYVFYLRFSYPFRRLLHKIKSFFKILNRKFKRPA